MVSAAGIAFSIDLGAGLAVAVMAMVVCALTWITLNAARMNSRLCVTIEGDILHLTLPAMRSYVRATPVDEPVELNTIDRLETRTEFFRSGLTIKQEAFMLIRKDGSTIFLGADRAMLTPFFAPLATKIANHIDKPVVDTGAVDGKAGFMAITGNHTPDWAAQRLTTSDIEQRTRHSQRAAIIIAVLVTGTLALRYLTSLN